MSWRRASNPKPSFSTLNDDSQMQTKCKPAVGRLFCAQRHLTAVAV